MAPTKKFEQKKKAKSTKKAGKVAKKSNAVPAPKKEKVKKSKEWYAAKFERQAANRAAKIAAGEKVAAVKTCSRKPKKVAKKL